MKGGKRKGRNWTKGMGEKHPSRNKFADTDLVDRTGAIFIYLFVYLS